jgi:hypothetical protein
MAATASSAPSSASSPPVDIRQRVSESKPQTSPATKDRHNPKVPDDPRKGMYGGSDRANGRVVRATVVPIKGERDWFTITLTVSRDEGGKPLKDRVEFYLHHTFQPDRLTTMPVRDTARLVLTSYGAFTVGVIADKGRTALELDLATLTDAPKRFLEN